LLPCTILAQPVLHSWHLVTQRTMHHFHFSTSQLVDHNPDCRQHAHLRLQVRCCAAALQKLPPVLTERHGMWHAAAVRPVQLWPSIQGQQLLASWLVGHAGCIWQLHAAVLQHLPEYMWLQGLLVVPALDVCCMCRLHLWWQHVCSCGQEL
jgi:hypothetical protein